MTTTEPPTSQRAHASQEAQAHASQEAKSQAYYDEFSKRYDRPRDRGYHAMLDTLETEALLRYARGKSVLELGCGTGLIMDRIKGEVASAVGIDLSEGMLSHARSKGHEVHLASVTDLPFEDEQFEVAYSFKVLAHVPDLGGALREAARVVKPGGYVLAELYNPLSLRYLAKSIAGPQKIGDDRDESDVFTRWDTPWAIERALPPSLEWEDTIGIRVLTPIAAVHKIPLVGQALRAAERRATTSKLRYFAGFMIAILRKSA